MNNKCTQNKKKLYIASPLFSDAELSFNRQIRDSLTPFFNIYLPQEDGGLMVNYIKNQMSVDEAKKKVFYEDIEALNECDIILTILDGRTIDEGVAFELGYAFAMGKKCIALQTDIRRLFLYGNNPMIALPIESIYHSVDELLSWARKESKIETYFDKECMVEVGRKKSKNFNYSTDDQISI